MKNKHLKIPGILLVLAWASCEKVEIPDSNFTGIPFGISGKAGTEDLKFGIEQVGIKLITGAELVEDSVWEFSGRLESSGPDGRFLSIQLRNRKEGNDPLIQWQPFVNDTIGFMHEEGIKSTMHPLRIKVENDENLGIRFIQAGEQRREISQNETTFFWSNKTKMPVCVDYGNDSFSGKFCTEVSAQTNVPIPFPNWLVVANNVQTAKLGARLRNEMPNTFNWGNGNQNSDNLIVDTPGTYEIQMTDNQNRKFSHSKQLLRNDIDGFYTYGNSIRFEADWLLPMELIDKKQLRSVNIIYKDRAGVIYRSNKEIQGINRFVIEEIREYERDGRGRPTLAMKVRFTARLFSQSGESILLENCHGWFGVGLP